MPAQWLQHVVQARTGTSPLVETNSAALCTTQPSLVLLSLHLSSVDFSRIRPRESASRYNRCRGVLTSFSQFYFDISFEFVIVFWRQRVFWKNLWKHNMIMASEKTAMADLEDLNRTLYDIGAQDLLDVWEAMETQVSIKFQTWFIIFSVYLCK